MTTEHSKATDPSRRKFLASGSVTVAGLSLAPGMTLTAVAEAKPAGEPVTSEKRWGILIDATKCTDCEACVQACNDEFNLGPVHGPQTDAQYIRTVGLRNKATGHELSLPLLCQHCEFPPCVDVCPTGASFRRADGIVLVDKHTCIGCRYCMMACPYKARSFVHEEITNQLPYAPRGKGTVESCTMCVHRVDEGGTPACVEACNAQGHQAMWFGDLKDENSEISQQLRQQASTQIRADLNLNTGVRYRGI